MMSGNWAQHSFLDQNDATNDYKTALTVVETVYNTTAFNDGYHTSHHLNPIRHWQDHPEHLVSNAEKFKDQRVIIFSGIDYWGIWCMLMFQNYDVLAKHFVDLTGNMTTKEKKEWLKARTRRLTSEQVEANYPSKKLK
jgi:Fatty acid desaturase